MKMDFIRHRKSFIFALIILLINLGYNFIFLRIDDERVFRFTDEIDIGLYCSDADLEKVRHLKNLKTLSVDSNTVNNLDFVYDLSAIQTLYIFHANQDMDISSISQCSDLENLIFWHANIENLDFLNSSGLKYLDLDFSNVYDISGISQFQSLESVYLNAEITGKITGTEELAQLPALHNLSLTYADLSDIDHILKCGNLTSLALIRSREPIDLKQLSELNDLEKLYIPGSEVENIASLAEFDSLKEVTLSKKFASDFDALDREIRLQLNKINIEFM